MSAMVCGKRSFFDELQSPSQSPPSISKKRRCSSTSPPPPLHDFIDQLRDLFPDMESQLLEKALEECGNDLDTAIKRLHELCRGCAEGKSVFATEADGEMASGKEPDLHAKFSGSEPTASAINNRPADGAEWVELIVREMISAASIDDARARAARVLESLEKSINAGASLEAAQNFHKENVMLKEHIEMILRDNAILKRAVAIQHERQKEYDDRNQEVQQLKQMIVQYQEHLRNLEVNNYALKMHLRQAQQGNSIPGRFHPDVF